MRYLILPIIFMFMISLVVAQTQTLGTFKQNQNVNLVQNCVNSTYSNVTRVISPTSIFLINSPTKMTKNGYDYNYTLTTTYELGNYLVYGLCDENGVATNWVYDLEITPSGTDNKWLIVVVAFITIYVVALVGFFGRNIWVAMLGGIGMIILGIYFMTNGIDAFRNYMTDAISWITVGLGAIISLTAGIDLIEENL